MPMTLVFIINKLTDFNCYNLFIRSKLLHKQYQDTNKIVSILLGYITFYQLPYASIWDQKAFFPVPKQ